MALTDKLKAIADAVRNKTGKTEALGLAQIPSEITALPTGNANEPFVEETYGANNSLISVKLVGYTKVRDLAFYNCDQLALIELPAGVTDIGQGAFCNCYKLALTELPAGITSIRNTAFYNCYKLALTELPAGITSIRNMAFFNCYKLALTELPAGITNIGSEAFCYCTNLVSITFKGTPITIDSSAFNGCTNLTTINVPWSEGEVANAPWSATNATINYNYVDPET